MINNATDVGNTFTALAKSTVLQIINVVIKIFQQNIILIVITSVSISLITFFVWLVLRQSGIKNNYSQDKFGWVNYNRGETMAMTKFAKPRPGIRTWS